MRRALGWLLLLLLPAFAWAEAGLPRIVAQKQSVQDAQPGIYAYTLTVSNQGESAVERIFVDESGLAGENLLSGGAFTGFTGGDALLNLNGTATILRLEPGQTVTLHYACPLPTNFQAERLQTQCNLSAMYTSGEGKDYLLLALADQPVTLAPPVNTQTEVPASAGLQEENPGGGVLEITLERESYDGAMPGHTYENAVTLRNAGTAPLTGINLRLDGFGDSGENAVAGAWMDTAGWTVRADGALEQPAGESLLPDESMVFRCCWSLPADAEGKAEGAVSAWVHSGTEPRQDVCAVFRLNPPQEAWALQLTAHVSLSADDCAWIAATLVLSAAMVILFRPGRFRPGNRGMRSRAPGAHFTSAA